MFLTKSSGYLKFMKHQAKAAQEEYLEEISPKFGARRKGSIQKSPESLQKSFIKINSPSRLSS